MLPPCLTGLSVHRCSVDPDAQPRQPDSSQHAHVFPSYAFGRMEQKGHRKTASQEREAEGGRLLRRRR